MRRGIKFTKYNSLFVFLGIIRRRNCTVGSNLIFHKKGNQTEAEVLPSSGLVELKLRLKIPQVRIKLQQHSTKSEIKLKREAHYFFRGRWVGGVEE